MTKINEMSLDVFTKTVKEALNAPSEKEPKGLINKALSSKVPIEDINILITDVYNQAGGFTLNRGVSKVRSAIENKIRAATATTLKGILVGSHDLVGKQTPNRYTLITADKKHLEVSSYESQVPFQGGKIDIPVCAGVVIKAEYDETYDSWTLISIENYQIIPKDKLIENLAKVIIPISAINQDYQYHKTDERPYSARPVVIAGTISRVSPEAVFRFEEDGAGNRTSQLDHYLPVFCEREMKKDERIPCLQFLLNSKTRGINSVRCHLQQQRKGTPTILVDDFEVACEEASRKFKEPDSQASSANEWLRDIPVIVVGTVNRYNKSTGQDKTAQNWVDIGVTAIVEVPEAYLDGNFAQKKITNEPPAAQEKPSALPPTHNTTSAPVEGPLTSTPAATEGAESHPPAEKKTRTKKGSTVQKNPESPAPAGGAQQEAGDEIQNAADKIFPSGGSSAEKPAPSPAAAPQSPAPAVAPAQASAPGSLPPKLLVVAQNLAMYCNVLDKPFSDLSIDEVKKQMPDVILIDGVQLGDVFISKIIDYLKAGGKV